MKTNQEKIQAVKEIREKLMEAYNLIKQNESSDPIFEGYMELIGDEILYINSMGTMDEQYFEMLDEQKK